MHSFQTVPKSPTLLIAIPPPHTAACHKGDMLVIGTRNLRQGCRAEYRVLLIVIHTFFLRAHIYFPASEQAVDTGVVRSPPRFLPSIFIAQRVQQSHCSSIFHRVLLTHALALSASQIVRKKKSPRIYTYEYALGGIRTHETDLYQARG